MSAPVPPDGFAPHFRKSKFTDPWEPIYSRVEARSVELAVFLRDVHCNSRGFVHGGLIAGLSDNAMGLTCVAALKADGREVSGLVTVSMNTDYLGGAQLGSWLIIAPQAMKLGGNLAFARAMLTADGAPIAQASAAFKIS